MLQCSKFELFDKTPFCWFFFMFVGLLGECLPNACVLLPLDWKKSGLMLHYVHFDKTYLFGLVRANVVTAGIINYLSPESLVNHWRHICALLPGLS